MGAQGQVVQETPMEEHRGIDESAAVEVEDEFMLRPFDELRDLMLEDLHLKACRGAIFLVFDEEASKKPRYTHGTEVLAATMLQFLHHLIGCGIAQRLEHQFQVFFRENNSWVHETIFFFLMYGCQGAKALQLYTFNSKLSN